MSSLRETVGKMVFPGRGILAIDESNETAGKRLSPLGLENTERNRRKYRELFIDTEDIESYLSGIILSDETLRQRTETGEFFVDILKKKDIIIGIKVDEGTRECPHSPNERMTSGLDTLETRLLEYSRMGARFAKWRAVIIIGEGIPSETCLVTNAQALAQFSKHCQNAGLVPMVEPEVLHTGCHSVACARKVTERTLSTLFEHLDHLGVNLRETILKTGMVLSGSEEPSDSPQLVGEKTVGTLIRCVPGDMGGVVFLSGGQNPMQAARNLRAIAKREPLPWDITFCFARAIQGPALRVWGGDDANIDNARRVYMRQLETMTMAEQGEESSDNSQH